MSDRSDFWYTYVKSDEEYDPIKISKKFIRGRSEMEIFSSKKRRIRPRLFISITALETNTIRSFKKKVKIYTGRCQKAHIQGDHIPLYAKLGSEEPRARPKGACPPQEPGWAQPNLGPPQEIGRAQRARSSHIY